MKRISVMYKDRSVDLFVDPQYDIDEQIKRGLGLDSSVEIYPKTQKFTYFILFTTVFTIAIVLIGGYLL